MYKRPHLESNLRPLKRLIFHLENLECQLRQNHHDNPLNRPRFRHQQRDELQQ
ncbi:hypothetical protein CSC14_3655 [Proteus mirabilis]|nr:hypothetical protein CSC14_3655 [Proteus mirabilis]